MKFDYICTVGILFFRYTKSCWKLFIVNLISEFHHLCHENFPQLYKHLIQVNVYKCGLGRRQERIILLIFDEFNVNSTSLMLYLIIIITDKQF